MGMLLAPIGLGALVVDPERARICVSVEAPTEHAGFRATARAWDLASIAEKGPAGREVPFNEPHQHARPQSPWPRSCCTSQSLKLVDIAAMP